MKKCLAILIGVALSVSASSQILRTPFSATSPFFNRWFLQFGGTVGLDFSQFSGIVGHPYNKTVVHKQENFATLAFGARFNVFEFSNTFSIAVAGQPLMSFGRAYNKSTGGGMNFMFRVPCTVDFNIGNAATSQSRSVRGVVIGAGMQWVDYPLFGDDIPVFREQKQLTTLRTISMNTNWWEPVVHLGIRTTRKHSYSNEVNIRAAYLKRGSLNLDGANNTTGLQTLSDFERFSIMLSYLVFLNY